MIGRRTMSLLKHLKSLPTWKPSRSLYFKKYTCKIELGPFTDWTDSVTVDKPHRAKIQYIFNEDRDTYDVYNTVYTSDLSLIMGLQQNYDYRDVYTPASEEHQKLLHTCKDNKVVIRDKLWYNKYRYKVEVWRNWRDTGFKEETLKEAHKFIQQSFDFNQSKTRRMSHYNAYSIPSVFTNDLNSIMLLKLAYNDTLRVHISEVTTVDELK